MNAWFLRGLPALAAGLSLASCGGSDSSVGPPPPTPHITIDVRFVSNLAVERKNYFTAATAKWARALSKDLGDFRLQTPANDCFPGEPALNETHHNLLVFVSVANIDGAGGEIAYTQICGTSSRDLLPVVAHIRLDPLDMDSAEARGVMQGIVLHELGHALGFNPDTYIPKSLAAGGSDDPYFTGAAARDEFSKHGAWYTGLIVPLENQSPVGPRDPHWRYNVFGDEVMAPGVSRGFTSPLSTITLGAFKDLGYEVDYSVADPYEVRPLFGDNRLVPQARLGHDLIGAHQTRAFSPTINP